MPTSKEENRPLNDFEINERAAEAEVLLQNPIFIEALDDVYSRAVGTMLTSDVGSLTASTAHATMKAIYEIKRQLRSYVTDKKMREKFSKGDKHE